MLNCTRVVDSVSAMVGLLREDALGRAAAVPPGADGLLLMPYLAGERTPNLPQATGSITGLTAENATPELLVRAALDGVAAGLAYAVEVLSRLGIAAPEITLVGGGSQHPAWRQAIADATGLPVVVRGGGEHAARGAAVQAMAIARQEPLDAVVARYRPEVVARIEPRPEFREAFRLDERRRMIEELKAGSGDLASLADRPRHDSRSDARLVPVAEPVADPDDRSVGVPEELVELSVSDVHRRRSVPLPDRTVPSAARSRPDRAHGYPRPRAARRPRRPDRW